MNAWEQIRRHAVEIHEESRLRRRIEQGEKLRVKVGFDPTAPDIHLGHTVLLRKLRAFQDLGHTAVVIVGDFTARIGDPSGKSETRPPLTREQVDLNAKTYLDQFFRVVSRDRIEIRRQTEWFDEMKLAEVLGLMGHATVAGLLQREDFRLRMEEGRSIGLHEFLYPLLQGYDSVAVNADLEMGGTDQLFNLLFAREVQRGYGHTPEDVMVHPILEGTDGVHKMSKSLGNYIGITDAPGEMFGKTMSLPDAMILPYLRLLFDEPEEALAELERRMAARELNPRDAKAELARRLVRTYHSEDDAEHAAREFQSRFSDHRLPDQVEEVILPGGLQLLEALAGAQLVQSRSEARRLLEQGGIRVNGEPAQDPGYVVAEGDLLQVGRRRFARVRTGG
ncbi:MAG: tyrosine--tRNA ligase [Candidatus Dormibacteria bacterium]